MRTSLVAASFGVALSALASGVSPSSAEPVTNAYPYCLLGRGGGSTTCYFRSRAECGSGCINNPAYVGEARARVILAGAGIATDSRRAMPKASGGRNAATVARSIGAIDPGAHASVGGSFSGRNSFKGWPSGYLMDRFGDHQAQGRF